VFNFIGLSRSRASRASALALLLFMSISVPVLAASGEPEAEPAAVATPSPGEIAALEEEEHERELWLASPEAEQQREASLTAFDELSSTEAQALVFDEFPQEIAALNADPARVLSELEVEKPLGTYAARIAAAGGESAIVESTVPVQSSLGGEGERPVDLTLERKGDALVPRNPLSTVEIPVSAGGAVKLETEIAVGLPAQADHEAVQFGDKNVFYPETDVATDTLVAPLTDGVEVFEQLRAPDSPEQFRFALQLPDGAQLRPAAEGGAEVVSGSGESIETVPPPTAIDAQGKEIAVTTSVEGNDLTVEVPHRGQEIAYPILVDPGFRETHTESPPFGLWYPNNPWGNYALAQDPSHLAAISRGSSTWYGANTWAQWEYTPAGSTGYIEEAAFSNIYFIQNGCGTNEPHGYLGIFNVFSNSWNSWAGFSGGYSYTPGFNPGHVGGAGTRKAIVGIGTGGSGLSLTCAHEIYVGGVTVKENDPETPSVSASGVPSGWIGPSFGAVTVNASDAGFGISRISMFNGGVSSEDTVGGCNGTATSRCPNSRSWSVLPPYREGKRTLEVTAEDPLGKVGVWSTQTKVDFEKPVVDLQGQLAAATKTEGTQEVNQSLGSDELSLPVYNLTVKATDGTAGNALTERSGVKSADILVDGKSILKEPATKPTPCDNCSLSQTFAVPLTELNSQKTHVLSVTVKDQAGNTKERKIEFEYIPATGMKDEYVMWHFPLDDGKNHEDEEVNHGPELAVNVMNGNLVYHERDVDVEGANADLEVERFYNSQLPASENTEWGDGWTLAQTPSLNVRPPEGSTTGPVARAVRQSGTVVGKVSLPESGGSQFVPAIHATVKSTAQSEYSLTEAEDGEVTKFNASGKTTELEPPGPATIDYSYEGGALSEIAVEDPNSSSEPPAVPPDLATSSWPVYSSFFGSGGFGNGQLVHPTDVALDLAGNTWVVDQGHDRLEKFAADGTYVSQFGTYGSAAGQLNRPRGVAVDSSGNLWVADTGNQRVQQFNAQGEVIRSFGSAGGGDGQFGVGGPSGIAVDLQGNLWVTDPQNNRVEKFSAKGTFLKSVGTYEAGEGWLGEPMGIDVGPDGTVWVADASKNRVVQFDSSGQYLRRFGSFGSAVGQFSTPVDVYVDGRGYLWVADQGNFRVQEFNDAGGYITAIGSNGTKPGQFRFPAAVAVSAKGKVWAVDNDVARKVAPKIAPPSSPGLVAAYSFDEGSGTVAHDSVGNHDGTLKNGAAWSTGKYGTGVRFDGVNDLVTIPASSDLNFSGNFTLEAWVRPDEARAWGAVITKEAPTFHSYELNAQGEHEAPAAYVAKSSSDNYAINGTSLLANQAWSHLALTNDGSYLRLYVNGTQVSSVPSGTVFTGEGATQLGGNLVWSDYFKGVLDEVRLYNRTLSATEIGQDKAAPIGWSRSNRLIAAYSFDEGSGSVAHDSVGDHDGAVKNGAEWTTGKYNGGLHFDGIDDLVTVPASSDLNLSKNFTLEAWVKPDEINKWSAVITKEVASGTGYQLHAEGEKSAPSGYVAKDGEGHNYGVNGTSALPTSAWSHLALTNDGTNLRLYVNGVQIASAASGPMFTGEGELHIGNNVRWMTEDGFKGTIDEVRLYNRTLSAGEVGQDKEASIGWSRNNRLIAAYSFDEGSGTILHDAIGTHDGTLKNGPAWTTAGKYNGGLHFDGVDDLVSIPASSDLNLSKNFTLEAWVKPDEANPWSAVITKESSAGSTYQLHAEGELKAPRGSAAKTAEGGNYTVNGPSALPVSAWSHLALTNDGTNLRLYVNGTLVATGASGPMFVSDGPLHIGDNLRWISEDGFKGTIDDVRLYNRTLSAAEIGVDKETKTLSLASGGNRVEKWTIPNYVPDLSPAIQSSFGPSKLANGPLDYPTDVAVDPSGNLWVTDSNNNRLEKFSANGEFISQFGTVGAGEGQFNHPGSVAIDGGGNLWVTDTGNNRVEKFSSSGTFLLKIGTLGAGNGQFSGPTGIEVGPEGNIWVADTGNNRLQVFNSKGVFVKVVGAVGSQPGQFNEPVGFAFDGSGTLWVADSGNDRVQHLTTAGDPLVAFGTEGSGNGQLQQPAALDLDENGVVWVVDAGNDRVEGFDEEGRYAGKFGSAGTGTGRFDLATPAGLTIDSSGRFWVTDAGNDRVQKWVTPVWQAEEEALESLEEPNDPTLDVATTSGLVTSVEGEGVPKETYSYVGDDLVAQKGTGGETKFEYDSGGRMTKVMLPNGTTAQIVYDPTYHRVTRVTVDQAGEKPAEATEFSYSNEPRRTVVLPEKQRAVTYDIGADGSVLKWWNSAVAPEITLAGTLYFNRGEVTEGKVIATGLHNLEVRAESEEGVSSIQVVAAGDQIVSERTCSQNSEVAGIECRKEEDEWVVETAELEPGIMQVEVLVEDRVGLTSAQRFWVNVPYTPPPSPEEPTRPKFGQIKQYRQSHGLDLDLNPITEEKALNDRIYNLIATWNNPNTPEGAVARMAMEEWGEPMRPVDVAEMEYREWYLAADLALLDEWGEAHPGVYAGYDVDDAAGGIIRVGFTENAGANLAAIQQLGQFAAADRAVAYTAPLGRSYESLEELMSNITDAFATNATLEAQVTRVGLDAKHNYVRVGARNKSEVESILDGLFGASAPIEVVHYEPTFQYHTERMMAGENLHVRVKDYSINNTEWGHCTAAYGAVQKVKRKDGSIDHVHYLLTAGHCSQIGQPIQKYPYPRGDNDASAYGIGEVTRSSFRGSGAAYDPSETDALAVKLNGVLPPQYIFWPGAHPRKVTPAGRVHEGDELCFSGVKTGKIECGKSLGVQNLDYPSLLGTDHGHEWAITFEAENDHGDSGAPVWDKTTHYVVGILGGELETRELPDLWNAKHESFAAPLIHPRGPRFSEAPGVFGDPAFNGLDLVEAP
jgi:sugar lactone lactonase YvrE